MELSEVFDAFDNGTGDGRDYDLTCERADVYVSEHPDQFVNMQDLTLEECVKALEVFRDAGFEEQWKRVQVFLWHRFEPQSIGGTYQATVRIPDNG